MWICGICILMVRSNPFLCVQCGKLMHSGITGVKGVISRPKEI